MKIALALVLAIHLHGPHVHPTMKSWAHQDLMPFPKVSIWIGYGDPETYPGNQVYLPHAGSQGWTSKAVRGLFFHEMGHVYDRAYMTNALRRQFETDIGVYPRCSHWFHKCQTVRWVVSNDYYINIAPVEMFAEEYAACALGLTQEEYQNTGYNSYGWVPPEGTDETELCGLIRSASFPRLSGAAWASLP